MKRKKIFIAALVAAALALAPMSMRSQVAIKGGTWGNFNNSGSGDNGSGSGSWGNFSNSGTGGNGSGSGSWGNFNNSGTGDNGNGSGSWGNFNNSGIGDNGNGNGSWGNFNNVDSYAHLGSGLVLLTVAGLVYAFVKRRKAKAS